MRALFIPLMFLLSACGSLERKEADAKVSAQPQVISTWTGTILLKSQEVLSVELQLISDGSARWKETRYETADDFYRKRPLKMSMQTGTYGVLRRSGANSAGGNGYSSRILEVANLQVGDWQAGASPPGEIRRYDDDYVTVLVLKETGGALL